MLSKCLQLLNMAALKHRETEKMAPLRHSEHPQMNNGSTAAQNYCSPATISTPPASQERTPRSPLSTRRTDSQRHQTRSEDALRPNEHTWAHYGALYCAQHLSASPLISLQKHRLQRHVLVKIKVSSSWTLCSQIRALSDDDVISTWPLDRFSSNRTRRKPCDWLPGAA